MIFPPKIQHGDTVGIVAPGRKISPAQLEPAIRILQSWGLQTAPGRNIFSSRHSYLSGSDAERLRDFQEMVDDPRVNVIVCARGGYGSTRIVDEVNYSALARHPKWIVGFSDVTAFHLRLASLGFASIHGTMPILFDRPDAHPSIESLHRILFSGKCEMHAQPSVSNRKGTGTGEVVGGNLSLIVDAMSTVAEPDTRQRILFIEEVDEYLYKLDRMLTQLRRSGKLKNLAGLMVGHMTDMKNPDLEFGETVAEIVLNAVRDYDFPVAFAMPSGHEQPNIAWIHGAAATLMVTDSGVQLAYPNIYSAIE